MVKLLLKPRFVPASPAQLVRQKAAIVDADCGEKHIVLVGQAQLIGRSGLGHGAQQHRQLPTGL